MAIRVFYYTGCKSKTLSLHLNMYSGVKVKLLAFVMALGGNEWLDVSPGRHHRRKSALYQLNKKLVGPSVHVKTITVRYSNLLGSRTERNDRSSCTL